MTAILYRDVREELEKGTGCVYLLVYADMKRIVSGACKGNVPYYSFISKEISAAVSEYLAKRREAYGSVEENEPLFASGGTNVPIEVRRRIPAQRKTVDTIVKRVARRAGLKRWKERLPALLEEGV